MRCGLRGQMPKPGQPRYRPGVGRVRNGKLIELELPDATPEAEIHRIARDLLSNPVIEDYSIARP